MVSDDRVLRLTKGQLVLCTAGEYSSFGVVALYEVLEDMDVPYKSSRYKAQDPVFDLETFRQRSALREVTYVELWQTDD